MSENPKKKIENKKKFHMIEIVSSILAVLFFFILVFITPPRHISTPININIPPPIQQQRRLLNYTPSTPPMQANTPTMQVSAQTGPNGSSTSVNPQNAKTSSRIRQLIESIKLRQTDLVTGIRNLFQIKLPSVKLPSKEYLYKIIAYIAEKDERLQQVVSNYVDEKVFQPYRDVTKSLSQTSTKLRKVVSNYVNDVYLEPYRDVTKSLSKKSNKKMMRDTFKETVLIAIVTGILWALYYYRDSIPTYNHVPDIPMQHHNNTTPIFESHPMTNAVASSNSFGSGIITSFNQAVDALTNLVTYIKGYTTQTPTLAQQLNLRPGVTLASLYGKAGIPGES